MIKVEKQKNKVLNCNGCLEHPEGGILYYISYGADTQFTTCRLCEDCLGVLDTDITLEKTRKLE